MAKVRVYELAKKYQISSEALIKILVKEGFAVKSHMSTVEERAGLLIEQHLNRVKEAAKKEVVKKVKKTDRRTLDESELSEVFGIDVALAPAAKATAEKADGRPAKSAARRSVRSAQRPRRRTVPPTVLQRAKAKRATRKDLRGE